MNKTTERQALTASEAQAIDAWWRAANYLSVGQIYLMGNPLLRETLKAEHIKPRLLGHWGTTPGLNFIYVHLNRLIRTRDLDMIFVCGPGHGGPAALANAWLEGSYSETYPDVSRDEPGMRRLFTQFSFPGGVPSHVAPETPGSIHEGGELGYSLLHATGAVFDNPGLIAACVIGDGEAETGPLAASWQSNKFLNPRRDGAVLPILHLNGWKIAGPTVLARIPEDDLVSYLRGLGWAPIVVAGDDPAVMHQKMAACLDAAHNEISAIQDRARNSDAPLTLPRWPLIVLRTPKGWTGPETVDGKQVEGTFRAHQVPLPSVRENEDHRAMLEAWMRRYRPEDLFDETGAPLPEITAIAPSGNRRMSANPHTNGGVLLRDLDLPDFRDHAVDVPLPGAVTAEATRVLGAFIRDVVRRNPETFRLFGPDETASNRLSPVFDVTTRMSMAELDPRDDHVSPDGRVLEVLSEHLCQGWLEGYLLTGRHGMFSCYEAFIHIVDSMFNQHAKWLKVTSQLPWRRPIASLNYLLTSHVWRQDHNGFSHQDPGFIDHVANKKAGIVRIYLPPDANTLLCIADHCLRSRHYVNVIVAGKQPEFQWLTMEEAEIHCATGLSIWGFASNDHGQRPDIIMASAGDVPTIETLAAIDLLRASRPELKIRMVNVVDLMALEPPTSHPHGMADRDYDSIFPPGVPVVFAFHGYPPLIHRLTYRRANHHDNPVPGHGEESPTTPPFHITGRHQHHRLPPAMAAPDPVPSPATGTAHAKQALRGKLIAHRRHVTTTGDDLPEVRDWRWPADQRGVA